MFIGEDSGQCSCSTPRQPLSCGRCISLSSSSWPSSTALCSSPPPVLASEMLALTAITPALTLSPAVRPSSTLLQRHARQKRRRAQLLPLVPGGAAAVAAPRCAARAASAPASGCRPTRWTTRLLPPAQLRRSRLQRGERHLPGLLVPLIGGLIFQWYQSEPVEEPARIAECPSRCSRISRRGVCRAALLRRPSLTPAASSCECRARPRAATTAWSTSRCFRRTTKIARNPTQDFCCLGTPVSRGNRHPHGTSTRAISRGSPAPGGRPSPCTESCARGGGEGIAAGLRAAGWRAAAAGTIEKPVPCRPCTGCAEKKHKFARRGASFARRWQRLVALFTAARRQQS